MPNGHHHLHFFLHHELNLVYLSVALRSFALSLLGIFVPLYLFQDRGFSLEQTLGFYLFYSVILAVSTPPAAAFSARFGRKHAVLVSVPLYLLFLLCLYSLSYWQLSLLIPATFLGISIAFYWMGMHQVIYNASNQKHRGEAIGNQRAATLLAAILGPLLGGLVISFFGFSFLFILAALLLLASAGFLFFSRDGHVLYSFSLRSIFLGGKHWRDTLFFTSQGTKVMAEGVIWPLFIFLSLGSYLSLGFLGTMLFAVGAVLSWIVGQSSDHSNKRTLIRWITPLESASWFLKSLAVTFPHILGVTFLTALVEGIVGPPLGALVYDKAKSNPLSYFVHREIFVCLGRILLLTLVLLTNSLSGGLFFQGLASLAALLF